MSAAEKPKIALWFRYGPAEHTELFHAMPLIVARLAAHAEVHYFGLKSRKPDPPLIAQHAAIHHLPFRVDRARSIDKWVKTALWVAAVPWMARQCRKLGVRAVYVDETVPLTAPLALRYFGPNVAMTVADFFLEIYGSHCRRLQPFVQKVSRWDLEAWRKLPLIFTRAAYTRQYLAARGFDKRRIVPVYDPCDFDIYHPADRSARATFGFSDEHVVLVHHGILHPNKGNDRILQALARAKERLPAVRYLLIGDGPDGSRLRRMVTELGLAERVVFTGWLPALQDVNAALNAGDIGLVMRVGQESDNFHTTGALVHSMACGLPVLAARLGGVSEIVRENEIGLLFDPNDMNEFLDKLQRLAADPQLRRRLGRAALIKARELFDMEKVAENTVRPLLNLLGI